MKAFNILKGAAAHTAFHDSAARFDAPKCHPRTRIAVLKEIMDWILAQDNNTRDCLIMWLTGAAGAGKSSIAQSIIELLAIPDDIGKPLLASFFFNKSDPTRNHAGALIATLAYQVYSTIPGIQSKMASVIENDPLILTKKLDHQLVTLILQPFLDLRISDSFGQPQSRYVIVIDGLDECTNRASQRFILKAISNGIRRFQLPIAFLVTSRPEHDINSVFTSKSMNGIHLRLMLDEKYRPDADIAAFLWDNIQCIREEHPFRELIPEDWPQYSVIQEIVKKSSGQFIYAATVIKFIESRRHRPDHQLDIVRRLRPAKGALPFQELDALYSHILSTPDTDCIEKVLQSLAFIFLCTMAGKDTPSVSKIEQFLLFDEGEFHLIFCDLGSLVEIRRYQDTLHVLLSESRHVFRLNFFHASMQDFLLDRARSKAFYIDIKSEETKMVATCLRHLSGQPLYFVYRSLLI